MIQGDVDLVTPGDWPENPDDVGVVIPVADAPMVPEAGAPAIPGGTAPRSGWHLDICWGFLLPSFPPPSPEVGLYRCARNPHTWPGGLLPMLLWRACCR